MCALACAGAPGAVCARRAHGAHGAVGARGALSASCVALGRACHRRGGFWTTNKNSNNTHTWSMLKT
eukprot:8641543-Pyramimonas_sp.AAC.1